MQPSRSTTLTRAQDTGATYHLLVALIFAACLPMALARTLGLGGEADAGTLAAAIDTARAAAARAFSLPG